MAFEQAGAESATTTPQQTSIDGVILLDVAISHEDELYLMCGRTFRAISQQGPITYDTLSTYLRGHLTTELDRQLFDRSIGDLLNADFIELTELTPPTYRKRETRQEY